MPSFPIAAVLDDLLDQLPRSDAHPSSLTDSDRQTLAEALAAVLEHVTCVVVAQENVDAKTNEVRHEAPCRIPGAAGMDSEGGPWARRLTWIRKVKGTRACRTSRRSCPDAWNDAAASPRDM